VAIDRVAVKWYGFFMMEKISFHQVRPEDAKDVQKFIYEDTLRIGVDENIARTVANPANDSMVLKQRKNLASPPVEGTLYNWVHYYGERCGVIKNGPWLWGDAEMFESEPYTKPQKLKIELGRRATRAERRDVGLHAFAVQEGLALAALRAVRRELIVPTAPIKAAVNIDDHELQAAFTELGAAPEGPVGYKTLGEYEALYMLRELPLLG
jgi:hypothetical protein